MKKHHFLNQVEHDAVQQAIREAEAGTSGDIVLYISHRRAPIALIAAHTAFSQLKRRTATTDNSLLIFIAPLSHTYAVVGGVALHGKMGHPWWEHLANLLGEHFRKGDFTPGLLATIAEAGRAFREHFPAATVNRHGQQDIVEE